MTLDRKKLIALGVILFLLIAALFTAYYVQNFVTSTRGRAAAPLALRGNQLDEENLTEESTVDRKDDTVHISLYKEEGSLYETQGKQEAAAREFIAENPRFETEEEAKQPKSLPQLLGLAPRGEELLPENIVSESTLVRSFEDEKDPYLARQGFRLEKDHYYYNQEIRDVPVFGATLAVHVKNDNEIYAVDGNLTKKTDVPRQQISQDQAKEIALAEAKKEATQAANLTVKETKKYVFNKAVLGLSDDATNYLTLAVTVGSTKKTERFLTMYFIDLTNATVPHSVSLIQNALLRRIFDLRDCPGGVCTAKRMEGGPPTNDFDIDQVYDLLGEAYQFYKNNYNRDSYDNRGASLDAFTHDNYQCPNASWGGRRLYFCDGTATRDIVGHELTHGVTEFTAGLIYDKQSGALNESVSDIFAYALDPNWTIGEGSAMGIIRSMDDPLRLAEGKRRVNCEHPYATNPNGNCYLDNCTGSLCNLKRIQPDRVFSPFYYCGFGDHGGVHTNSGVINKMFYLMVTGGNFNGCNLSGIGAQKAHAITYRALTTYLTQTSNFKAMYASVNRACDDLYQPNSDTCNHVKRAMQATEIDQQADFTQTGAKCSGQTRQTPACALPSPSPTQSAPTPTAAPTPTQSPTTFGKAINVTNPDLNNAKGIVIDRGSRYTPESEFTIEFWLRFNTQIVGETILDLGNGRLKFGTKSVAEYPTGTIFYVFSTDAAGGKTYYPSQTILNDVSGWHHTAITFKDGKLVFYFDGRYENMLNLNFNISDDNKRLEIGKVLDAQIDEIRISDRARYPTAYVDPQTYTTPRAPFSVDLNTLTLLHLDGNTTDATGNGNNGSTFGNTVFVDSTIGLPPTPTPIRPTLTPSPTPTATPTPLPTNAPTPIPPSPTPTPCILPKTQGNANGDCAIDILDFTIWREEFIQEAGGQQSQKRANFDDNPVIDLVDFSIWRNNFRP